MGINYLYNGENTTDIGSVVLEVFSYNRISEFGLLRHYFDKIRILYVNITLENSGTFQTVRNSCHALYRIKFIFFYCIILYKI